MKFKLSVFILVVLLVPVAGEADIYLGQNENGVISLTDNPGDSTYQLLLEVELPENYELPSGEKLEEIVSEASKEFGPPEALIYAIIQVESSGDSKAVSHQGARGLMQLMPQTARELGVEDIHDPRENIRAGTRYLHKMITRFGGDLQLALAAYNAGPGRVKKHGEIPPLEETRGFVRKVNSAWNEFKSKNDTIYTYRDENGIINVTNIK